jgi:hypothetical protein
MDVSDRSATNLYSVARNLYLGLMLIAISRKAGVPLVPKQNDGTPPQVLYDAARFRCFQTP